MEKARLTFLGTGTSQGVPMIGCDCPVCTSTDHRDKRLRASALIEYCGLTILVDAGPDFRYQMLRQGVNHLDAILLTHNHKDHTGGLDDIRAFNLLERHPVNIYCLDRVEKALRGEYPYAFAENKYPGAPEWRVHTFDPSKPFTVPSNANEEILVWEKGFGYRHYPAKSHADAKAEIIPLQGWHHNEKILPVVGYRFGNIAYLTDIHRMDDAVIEKIKGVDYVTLGCVKIDEHYAHPSLQQCLDFFEKVGAKESYITHMSHLLPKHSEFAAMLPDHVHPAYDGLVIE
ncbi:MAG: MBL fold metallo-hydrolase [Bacteroidales bacterium]|nr:MBL fold metallo-hydrolase [Bacteroidales bacterium]MDD6773116.1 MBL fold metallo-hydrolase [Bacteroidales bacterium]MDO4213618.1 MBL fold metallo-hydrolase [Bacteroidales bacterium]